jgi:hypothetical protein
MKGLIFGSGIKANQASVIVLFIMAGILLCPAQTPAADDSGLGLSLYETLGQTYELGHPVPLIMVYKNIAPWPLSTERLFPEHPFHQSVNVTDPSGEKHKPKPETDYDKMPPPISWNDGKKVRQLLPAGLLPKGWVKSVEIADLRDLFPVMKRMPGTYLIDAEEQFVRFAWTVDLKPHGLMGIADDRRNWQGTVKSENQIKIVIAPPLGARIRVRVIDRNTGSPEAIPMHAVRVYKGSNLNLAETWTGGEPFAIGTSGLDGWVVWDPGDPCLPYGDYTVVAKYTNEYGQETIAQADPGWAPGCSGEFVKRIFFGAPVEKYSVFATNSVLIHNKAVIKSGSVGAPNPSSGPWLSAGVEVDIAQNVMVEDGNKIIGDSVAISSSASVFDIYYNSLSDAGGEISGALCSPLDNLPETCEAIAWDWTPPGLPSIDPDGNKKNNFVVPAGEVKILPGEDDKRDYYDVVLESNSVLKLSRGEYHFMNLDIGSDSSVICEAPCDIRIQERLYPGTKAYIGPGAGGFSRDVVIYVAGVNGRSGGLNENPKAADIGQGSIVNANIYAPNGTLLIEEGCTMKGAFVAKDVVVGQKTVVDLDSFFQE